MIFNFFDESSVVSRRWSDDRFTMRSLRAARMTSQRCWRSTIGSSTKRL